jgi:hypothetical protein
MMRISPFALLSLAPCLALSFGACSSSDTTGDSPSPGIDAGTDTSSEAAADVAPDVTTDGDVAPDVSPDVEPDVAPDVVEAAVEAGPEAGPDAPTDGPGPDQDAGNPWPTCDAQPTGVPDMTLPQIWASNPTDPTEVWITGLYVTAISRGGCSGGNPCQVFLQDAETYTSFDAGAKHAMKLFVSSATAQHFNTLKIGDRVNVLAHAWRYNLNPSQNELLLQVNNALRGCAKTVGTGTPTPIAGVELADLTQDAYENTHGPLLVKVDGVSGKPGAAIETFALWKTGGPFVEAGLELVVSASPYFLSSGAFSGLPTNGTTTVNFASITGVFGLFVPTTDAGGSKYLMLYPRNMGEMPTL